MRAPDFQLNAAETRLGEGRHFTDNISKCILSCLLNQIIFISIKISLINVFSNGPINSIPALVPIMAWHKPGAKPLSEPMVFLTDVY